MWCSLLGLQELRAGIQRRRWRVVRNGAQHGRHQRLVLGVELWLGPVRRVRRLSIGQHR